MRLPIFQRPKPRYSRLSPRMLVFSLALGLLVLGVFLLVRGSVALGVIAIVVAVCLPAGFLARERRWPDTAVIARAGTSTVNRVRDETGAAVTSISTWSKAGRDTVRLRKEQFQLRRERDTKIRDLGQSVFDEDGRADELKAAAKELDGRIAVNEQELTRTIAAARTHVRKGRAAVVATEVISPEPEAEAEPEPTTEDER